MLRSISTDQNWNQSSNNPWNYHYIYNFTDKGTFARCQILILMELLILVLLIISLTFWCNLENLTDFINISI